MPRLFDLLDTLPDGIVEHFSPSDLTASQERRCGWCFAVGVGFDHLDPVTGRYTCESPLTV